MPTEIVRSGSRERAVVLGGSISGLLTALVLAERYADVIMVERDELPRSPDHRRGVPHGHHVHGLLPSGLRLMEELLPGLTADLVALGALGGDILADTRWYLGGRMLRQAKAGLPALSASRPLIEHVLRTRVRSLANVTLLDGYDVVGLCPSADRRRITGARVTSRHGAGSRLLTADLVVDATGRGSRASAWLDELGFASPTRDEVTVDLSYASRLFHAPVRPFGDDIVVVTARYPGQKRSSVMQRLEGDRVLVTLAGILGERPPVDLTDFAAYAGTLSSPDTYDLVSTAVPLGDPATFRFPTYTRLRYERLGDLPAGFLAAGDAVCSFNPVYGQGMSVAASGAAALRDELRNDGEPDPYRYFQSVAQTLEAPWGLAVGADLAIEGVTGPPPAKSPLTGEYLAALQRGATEDAELAIAFIRVTSLIDSPRALLAPEIVERVRRVAMNTVAVNTVAS